MPTVPLLWEHSTTFSPPSSRAIPVIPGIACYNLAAIFLIRHFLNVARTTRSADFFVFIGPASSSSLGARIRTS